MHNFCSEWGNLWFLKSHFGHVTSYELTLFKKMVRVWKTKSLLFCLTYETLMVFWRQNHITFIFMKMMSHDLLVQMAYWRLLWWSIFHKRKESYRLMTYYSNQANKWNGHREFLCYRFLWLFLVVNLLIKSLPSSREEKVVKEKSDDKTYRSRYFLQSSK